MIKHYRLVVDGSGADGQTFQATTELACEFHEAMSLGMVDIFQQITQGRATYGNPGVGCRGPYDIHRVLIEQVKQ